jgi:hypothetical protein
MLIDVCFDEPNDLIYVNKCCICLCYKCFESLSTSVFSRQNMMCCSRAIWNEEVMGNFDWLTGSQ